MILKGYIEAYNIVERRVKSNNKMLFHRKILIFLLIILDQLYYILEVIWYDSGQILCFSNIEVAYHFKKASDVRICSMAKNKNLKMLDATNLLSKHHFGFNNQKSHLEAITVNAHG